MKPKPTKPDCPNHEAWQGYMEVRKIKKFPMTARAITILVNKLLKLRSESHDIGKCLDQSTERGYNSVYASQDSFIEPVRHKKVDDFKRGNKVIGMKDVVARFKEQGII